VFTIDVVGGAGFVGVGAEAFGAFGLDAPEAGAVVDDEVVAFAVSPGLGDGELEAEGAGEEGGFGALAGALGVGARGWGGGVFAAGFLGRHGLRLLRSSIRSESGILAQMKRAELGGSAENARVE
jgi:hypothetical protein